MTDSAPSPALLSLVVPVYRGESILDDTFSRLIAMEKELPSGTKIEIIAVDDGSDDESYAKILQNQEKFPEKICAIKLSRNYGAVAASHAGYAVAQGDCIAIVPQDLQEPIELFIRMFAAWQRGVKVNIGIRENRDESLLKKIPANLYHFLFRMLVASDYPKGGLCTYLIDRQVLTEFQKNPDKGADPATRLFTMGYSRQLHLYNRLPPKIKSTWTFSKQIKLVIDNFISFSYLPVRLMSLAGIIVSLASFCFAGYVFIGKFTGWYLINQPPGWATIVVLLSFLLGMLMLMLGVIGEYLWRILDHVRGDPLYRVEEMKDSKGHKQSE